jgi:hypothetical protein
MYSQHARFDSVGVAGVLALDRGFTVFHISGLVIAGCDGSTFTVGVGVASVAVGIACGGVELAWIRTYFFA